MDTVLLWVTGRAASGKSTFARIAHKECKKMSLDILSLSDEALLFQIIEEDTLHEHHYHPHNDERFLFHSNYPFDEGIRRINTQLVELLNRKSIKPLVAIIELARGKCSDIMNLSFKKALSLINEEVIDHSHFYYINTSWEKQLERNKARENDGKPHPPDSIMKDLYSDDDVKEVAEKISFEIVNNNGDLPSFEAEVRLRIQKIIPLLMQDQSNAD
jgi:dephospho-CoA kinase